MESLQESSIRGFIIWNVTSQIISKKTKTPGPSRKTFSSIQNKEIQNKKLNTNYTEYHLKPEFRETANSRKRNWNELQIDFRSWWYEHQESRIDKIITPTNSIWAPKHWEPSKKVRLVGSDAKRHPTFHATETLAWLVYTNRQFSSRIRAFDHDWRNQQPVSEYFVEVSRSIILEASSFKTTPRKLISKKHENLVPKKQDHFIDTKQRSPQKVENQRSIISFRTGIPRDSKF